MLSFPPWKIAIILGICVLGLIYSLPNLFPRAEMERMPDWLPHEQINLGLDLQGGSHLLLEVELDAVIEERLNGLVDEVRGALRAERIGYRGLGRPRRRRDLHPDRSRDRGARPGGAEETRSGRDLSGADLPGCR